MAKVDRSDFAQALIGAYYYINLRFLQNPNSHQILRLLYWTNSRQIGHEPGPNRSKDVTSGGLCFELRFGREPVSVADVLQQQRDVYIPLKKLVIAVGDAAVVMVLLVGGLVWVLFFVDGDGLDDLPRQTVE